MFYFINISTRTFKPAENVKPLSLKLIELDQLAAQIPDLNAVPSVLISIIQIPLYFKYFVEFMGLISLSLDSFVVHSLEPYFLFNSIKDWLLEFKLAVRIDCNSQKNVVTKEMFQPLFIKVLKNRFYLRKLNLRTKNHFFR